MATYGHTFTSGDTLTPPKLNDARTVTDIVDADIASGANIALSKLATGALPTAITVANANLADDTIAGSRLVDDGVTPAKLSQPLTFRTAQATTSGQTIPFADIPSWVKRITVMLNQVSTNGTSAVIIQLGDSGGFEETDYIGTGTAITGTNTCGVSAFTTGFSAGTGALITSLRSGVVSIVNVEGNTWVASGTLSTLADGSSSASHTQGVKVLSGTLDRVRLTTITGANTFDAGSVNIAYEG